MRERKQQKEQQRQKEKARPRRVANAIAGHVSKRSHDAMHRLWALHELRPAIERELEREVSHEPHVDDLNPSQVKGYHPALARKQAQAQDYSIEEAISLFIPVERLLVFAFRGIKVLVALGKGWKAARAGNAVKHPYAMRYIMQSEAASAQAVRAEVQSGKSGLYKVGDFEKSTIHDAQFFAPEHPITTPNFGKKYGIPDGMEIKWVMKVSPKASNKVITRVSEPLGNNPGGAIEAVTPKGNMRIDFFHMTSERLPWEVVK